MTYCIDFFRKFKKEGNFCGLDKGQVSRLNAYMDIVELLMKQNIPEEQVYKNFTVNAATPLIASKGDAHTEGLNYVTAQLKKGKTVTNGDVQTTLKSCSTTTPHPAPRPKESCKFTTSPTEHKPSLPVEKPKDNGSFHPPKGSIPVTTLPPQPSLGDRVRQQEITEAGKSQQAAAAPPVTQSDQERKQKFNPAPPKPAPCLSGKPCPDPSGKSHVLVQKVLGNKCTVSGALCKDMPECPLERVIRLKGTAPDPIVPASQLQHDGLGNTFVKPAPLTIKKTTLTDTERDQMVDALLERTRFTPNDLEIIGDLLKMKKWGWTCRFDLVEAAVLNMITEAGGA